MRHYFLLLVLLLLTITESSSIASTAKTPLKKNALTLNTLFNPVKGKSVSAPPTGIYYFLTGTAGDTVNDTHLCIATDNTCSSCSSAVLEITSGTPLTVGQQYKIPNASLTAYLTGQAAGTYYIRLYVSSTGENCTTPGGAPAYCGTHYDGTGSQLCISTTFNGTAVTNSNQSDNHSISLITPSQYVYVPDFDSSQLDQCLFNTDGSLTACYPAAPIPSALGTTIAIVNGTPYLYVAGQDGFGAAVIYQCLLQPDGSNNPNCSALYPAGPGWTNTSSITTATINGKQYAYVGADDIAYQCPIQNDGSFGTCQTTAMTMSGTQSAITFAATNGTLHAYGVSYNSTEVTQCAVNDNGSFFNCVPTGQTLTNPTGLAFSTSGSTQYAYITQHGSTTVTQCTIKTDGSFDTCTTAGTLSSNLTGISFGVVSGTQYAFVSTNSGAVYHCSLNNDGSFNTCVSTQVATAIKSNVVAGYALGYSQYSYVVDGSNVDLCSLNSVNGSFGTCNATGSGWTTPQTTATTTVYSASGIPRQYAYITDTTAPGVYYCPVNENGTLSACGITATGVTWTSPFGIVFQTINGTQYAYITDMGDSSGTPAVQGSVQQCTVENTGVLDNCNSLSPTFSSGGPLEYPQALTIQTFNQTYAYITDNGSIYQCTFINANDATNGNLTNCIQTGGSAINNTSIAFATMPDDNTPYLYLTNPSVSGTTPAFMLVDTDIDSTTGLPLGSSFFQGMGPWTGDIATWGIAMGVTIATFDQQYAYIADSGNAAVFQCTFQTGNHGLINIPCAPTSVGTFTTPTNILFSQALITS